MKYTTLLVAVAFCVALVSTSPVPQNEGLRSQALERLVMVEGDNEEALRSKRTIGVLRQLFPGISQIVEQKVSAITSEIIRILGPVILRGVLGGGGGGGGTGGSNSKSNPNGGTTVELPIPDDDDDDDDNDESSSAIRSKSRVSISLPTFPPDEEDDFTQTPITTSSSTTTSTTTTTTSTTTTEASVQNRKRRARHVEWKRLARDVNREAEDRLIEDTAESQNNEIRVQFADDRSNSAANEAVESELAPLEDIEVSDDENRNKRFLNFGFGASGGAGGGASSGSGGGSGNFLFDIIRLVAGSGSTQATDVAAGAPSPGGRNDGTAEAVPGPVTRLFVIANRGISNLIQDLILRLAATSERIVNFKARLITSII